MSCNCKNNKTNPESYSSDRIEKSESFFQNVVKYTLKFFGFLMFLLILPILNIVIVWYAFRMLILDKNIDLRPILFKLGDAFRNKEDDEYYEVYESSVEDLEMMDVEVLTRDNKDVEHNKNQNNT